MFQSFMGGQHAQRVPRHINFSHELRIYPASFAFREDIEKGDKILLPTSALNELYPLISSGNKAPMVFCLKHGNRLTYCGVLEFVAQEGLCYIPNWMFRMLKFPQPGTPGNITLVPDMKKKNSKQSYFIKLRPHLTKFIELNNPKAVLEYQLRNFTCLHEGDTITITAFDDKFEIDIMEIKPKNDYNAICIIDTDVEVDFAPPLDYEEPSRQNPNVVEKPEQKQGPFKGQGLRIDEKKNNQNRKASQVVEEDEYDPRKHRIQRGVRRVGNDWKGNGVKVSDPVGSKKR